MTDQPILDIRHAAKSYGAHRVLKDISLTVKRGEIVLDDRAAQALQTQE